MQVVWGTEYIPDNLMKRPVVTIGNFDGCHKGHQEIFRKTRAHAALIGGVSVAYTFDPHPAFVIKGITPQLIFTVDEKIKAIESLGIDVLIIAPFTKTFADIEPEIFIRETIIHKLGAYGLVVGHDFSFGKRASGDIPFLKRIGERMGFFVECVEPIYASDSVVSSTRIRKMIQSGDVSGAGSLMLYPYRISGTVIHGKARGRDLGFPTANIKPNKELLPAYGVYASYIYLDNQRLEAVVNIGNNPTFGDNLGTSIEAFLLDFEGDLYSNNITVEFIEYVRGEIKFADKQYLIDQIRADCIRARDILNQRVM